MFFIKTFKIKEKSVGSRISYGLFVFAYRIVTVSALRAVTSTTHQRSRVASNAIEKARISHSDSLCVCVSGLDLFPQ